MNAQAIEDKLKQAFPDCDVLVNDLTGGGDHWEVRIASSHFKALNRVKQHQSVMHVFDDQLKSGEIHALSIKTVVK